MELVTKKRMQIFSGRGYPDLGEAVAEHLGMKLGDVAIDDFANEEIYCRYQENIRGCDVFVVQTHCSPINQNIMEHCIMIEAAKRASAKRITAVAPFFGYARQDKKARSREPITARLLADMLTVSGADRVVSVDLHSQQLQGFFDQPLDHLTALPLLVDWLRGRFDEEELVVASPDAGRVDLMEKFLSHLPGATPAYLAKTRTGHNVARTLAVTGDVEGKVCALVDDMIDTAGTICGAAEALMERGARKVLALATHPVLSGPALERIDASPIDRVVVTNTLPIPEGVSDKIEVVSIAPIVASTMRAIFEDQSVSELFDDQNQ
ncbi:ribose-phosphate diphosphokinase [Egibacter rhizosphaerae]|uniref:Ribose-phosphate pyrophosphokinase n=1 Tax=Egibacter rhizosphaerae TaxID=1670831 RepID=A0A411YIL2_9ACTN|nr:ribose-phosphate diphosphokinase [Egibacter rhizosphaerae]QBI21108.1 ribose-phosphate diphosphokinase [Egibacter rhizosphaerae]